MSLDIASEEMTWTVTEGKKWKITLMKKLVLTCVCTLTKYSHTPVFFQALKQTSWEMRGEVKNNESVFQGDDKNSSC